MNLFSKGGRWHAANFHTSGFPAGFHLLGGGGELKDFGGSSLGRLGVKNKVSTNFGGE